MKALYLFLVLLLAPTAILADVYMHCPRGSNNRLNEANTNRNNDNRVCDTQNNAKGGYAVGPSMYYLVGSRASIEWTNQHGCGGNSNTRCNIVIQYMCGDLVRDGTTTNTIPDDPNQYNQTVKNPDPTIFVQGNDPGAVNATLYTYGMHEGYQYYQDCKNRTRNMGLFIADQNVGTQAINTRQNPGGGRSGYECSEERDYYPYWHPTPWKDIVVLTDDTGKCKYYSQNTENKNGRNYCSLNRYNNYGDCNSNGGQWLTSDPLGGPFDCQAAPYSRDNHLGNGDTHRVGYEGVAQPNTYFWNIPDDTNEKCILRLRYNVTSADYDPWNTFSDSNGAASPVVDDPYFDWTGDLQNNLSLAINTAQFGRTFQDRSYTFAIRSRGTIDDTQRIYNLNVRGKRGNIVQVYPAVEYDFCPNKLSIIEGSYVHFQWTGSNKNPQGNDGEGTAGTDKSNMVLMSDKAGNYPKQLGDGSDFLDDDTRYYFGYLGQTNCLNLSTLTTKNGGNANNIEQDVQNCMKLNAASLYFDGGTHKMTTPWKTYNYLSTRNNNFTNRSQKGMIVVNPFLPVWAIVLVVFSGVVCLVAVPVAAVGMTARFMPDSKLGMIWKRVSY